MPDIISFARRAVSLFAGMVAAEWQAARLPHWPDGEQPLVEATSEQPSVVNRGESIDCWGTMPELHCRHPFGYDHPCPKCGNHGGNVTPQSSAGSATSEAGVEPAEQVPTPESALPQPGVGHLTDECICPTEECPLEAQDINDEAEAEDDEFEIAVGMRSEFPSINDVFNSAQGLRQYDRVAVEPDGYWDKLADKLMVLVREMERARSAYPSK